MTARAAPADEQHESLFRKWGTLLVLSLALTIVIIDSTLLNVSLATLTRELHTTLQSLQWVISAYSLMLAALTVTGGRLGDLFGRNASLLVAKYRGHDRAIAFGIWGGAAAAASAIGPILGGFLTTHYSWRWGFRINVFVAALLVTGSIIIDDTQPEAGEASGVTNTFRQIGASLGAAIDEMLRMQASGLAFGGNEIFQKMSPNVRGENDCDAEERDDDGNSQRVPVRRLLRAPRSRCKLGGQTFDSSFLLQSVELTGCRKCLSSTD